MNHKLAFIHFGKAGGSYINFYLRKKIKIDEINSWHPNSLITCEAGNWKRDWTEKELLEISNFEPTSPTVVHNHHNNWTAKAVHEFNSKEWLTFMFIRDPRDIICSLYFYAHRLINDDKPTPLGPVGALAGHLPPGTFIAPDVTKLNLDKFVYDLATNDQLKIFWKLPSFTGSISYVREMSDENFGKFCKDILNFEYFPINHINTTQNKGYKYYLNSGEISSNTYQVLIDTPEFNEYKEYLIL